MSFGPAIILSEEMIALIWLCCVILVLRLSYFFCSCCAGCISLQSGVMF